MTDVIGNKDDRVDSAAEERLAREAALDETIAASFPASDPPSTDPNPRDCQALDASAVARKTTPEA